MVPGKVLQCESGNKKYIRLSSLKLTFVTKCEWQLHLLRSKNIVLNTIFSVMMNKGKLQNRYLHYSEHGSIIIKYQIKKSSFSIKPHILEFL